MGSKLRTASWVVLAVMGTFVLLVSLISTSLAYGGGYDIGGVKVEDVAAGRPEVLSALRGIRGTSAAFAGAYAVLFLSIVVGPYRKGETWAWWALLGGLLLLSLIVVLRIPLLGTTLGVGTALLQCGLGLVALLMDVSRLREAEV